MIFLLLVVASSHLIAATPVWHTSKVNWIYPLADGSFVLTFKEQNSGCTNNSNYFYVRVGKNSVTEAALKNMLSVALSAGASGKTLNVNFDADTPECYVNRLFISY